jgi:hypothetical protein
MGHNVLLLVGQAVVLFLLEAGGLLDIHQHKNLELSQVFLQLA